MNDIASILVIGTGATAIADLWGLARRPLLGVAPPDYRMVGRWFGHMLDGRFRHEAIAGAPAVRGERFMGWAIHYGTGILFATLLVGITGTAWLREPTLAPALAIGIGTVLAPFLLMQPGMGAGIAARRMPRPNGSRVQSLLLHAAFGLGLYATARAIQMLQIS